MNFDYYFQKLQKNTFSIFLFHGVIDKAYPGIRNYTNKHILKKDFEKLLEILQGIGNPISLDDIVKYHEEKKTIPENSFSITFDDGFENNFSIAKPILENLSIPATFYISTNLIDQNLMTWTDQIEFCIDLTKIRSIKLPWSEKDYSISTPESKVFCLEEIRKIVKRKTNLFNIENLVQDIFRQCKVNSITKSNSIIDKKMNWSQIEILHNHSLFSIGGHSHNHTSLGMISKNKMKKEIRDSINMLRDKANVESMHYSYPEGQKIDYNNDVIETLINNNIRCCPTAIEGTNNNNLGSLFNLKRITVY